MEALLKVVAMVHHMVEVAEHSKDAQRDHSGHTKQLSLLPLLLLLALLLPPQWHNAHASCTPTRSHSASTESFTAQL
jgi:hypothetical protein